MKAIYAGKVLSVDDIMREYHLEQEATKAKYEDKKITLSGIIENFPLEQKSGYITVRITGLLYRRKLLQLYLCSASMV